MSLKGVFYGNSELGYIIEDNTFQRGFSTNDGIRLLKTKYPTMDEFKQEYLSYFDYENHPEWNLRNILTINGILDQRLYDEYARVLTELRDAFIRIYNEVEPFSAKEIEETKHKEIRYHLHKSTILVK